MLMIVGAIANDGQAVMPYLVERITTQNGDTVLEAETTLGAQMFSESTAARLQELLRSNVENYYGDRRFCFIEM